MTSVRPVYLSILIPVHNQELLLQALLQSLFTAENASLPIEVIVCDDGSERPVVPAVPHNSPFRIVRHSSIHGAAAARNTAAAAARGEVLLFLDADTVLGPGSLRHTIGRFRSESDLTCVNGGADIEPANPEAGFTPRYRAMIDHVQQNIRAPQACSFFTPRCGALRRDVFFRAGRFDESFRGASVEEYEFGHRLVQIAPIRFDAKLSVRHHYAGFWRNSKNYFTRVRRWVGLLAIRKQFDNYGSATGAAAVGSLGGFLWIPALLLPRPFRELVVAVSVVGFLFGYRDIFVWSLRLKGAPFFMQSLLLTWWLCFMIVPGALLGALDFLKPRRQSSPR